MLFVFYRVHANHVPLQYKNMQQELSIHVPDTSTIAIKDSTSLSQATSLLSELNKSLDTLTAHKEAKTKPINEALKKIREDYRPLEQQLTQAITQIKQSILQYTQEQAKIALQREEKILNDKRTTLTTKIAQLAKIDQTPTEKVTTDNGAITFTTTKKYTLSQDITASQSLALLKVNALTLDVTALKAYMKQSGTTPEGITITEEQTLRNYR